MTSSSSVTRRTSASGVSWPLARIGTNAAIRGMRKRRMGVLSCGWSSRTRFDLNARRPVPAHSLLGLFLGLAEQELTDEPLEHHRRLRDGDAVALGELL